MSNSRRPDRREPSRGSFFVTGKFFSGTILTSTETNLSERNYEFDRPLVLQGNFLVSGSVFDKSPVAVLTDQLLLFPNDTQSIATTEGAGIAVRPVIGRNRPVCRLHGEAEASFSGLTRPAVSPAGHDQTSENNELSITPIFNDRRKIAMKRMSLNEPPYFHHGRFSILREAVLAHAGAALNSRIHFRSCCRTSRTRVSSF